MKIKELRQKQSGELNKLLKLTREQVRDLRFKVAAKQHKDVRDLRESKHLLAKIMTILKEREYEARIKAIKQLSHQKNGKKS
jgi:ribosomal protein L29